MARYNKGYLYLTFLTFQFWIKELISTSNTWITVYFSLFVSEAVVSNHEFIFPLQKLTCFLPNGGTGTRFILPPERTKTNNIKETMVCKILMSHEKSFMSDVREFTDCSLGRKQETGRLLSWRDEAEILGQLRHLQDLGKCAIRGELPT